MEEESDARHGRIYFVSGIDTDVGKTVVTGLMARHLASRGVDAITVKMIQTGCDGFSEDLDRHRLMCGIQPQGEDGEGLTAPQIFRFPSSPLLAARLEGRTVDLARIAECVDACAARRDVVLVEGAGGLLVPLTENVLAADFAASRGWPLILVACGRLGAINHTLLSLEAARARGMRLAGVVLNWHHAADPVIDEDTEATVRASLAKSGQRVPVVRVPRVPEEGPFPDVDFSDMFA